MTTRHTERERGILRANVSCVLPSASILEQATSAKQKRKTNACHHPIPRRSARRTPLPFAVSLPPIARIRAYAGTAQYSLCWHTHTRPKQKMMNEKWTGGLRPLPLAYVLGVGWQHVQLRACRYICLQRTYLRMRRRPPRGFADRQLQIDEMKFFFTLRARGMGPDGVLHWGLPRVLKIRVRWWWSGGRA